MIDLIDDLKKNPNKIFVIAEIGNNHQGSVELCKDMIIAAKYAGANAVKLQKRNNKLLYTKSFYNSPYVGDNSFATTYGQHRDFLELSENDFIELKNFSNENNIIFFATPFEENSFYFLESIDIPFYKLASADIFNLPLIKKIAETGKPIIMSTGGAYFKDIQRAYELINSYHNNLIILHCTASYPVKVEEMNLNVILKLKDLFPNNIIGLSDHENGIDAASVAYMLGARVFEKHFTTDRSLKGTDQSFSLEPTGLKKMIRNLNRIPKLLGSSEKKLLESEKGPLYKMQKSIVAKENLKKGIILKEEHLEFKSPFGELHPYETHLIIGKELKVDVAEGSYIKLNQF